MTVSSNERLVKGVGLVALVALAVATLVIDTPLETILFMTASVIAALAAFDAAMDRKTHSFWPWILVTIGVLAKTIPTVYSSLTDEIGSALERSDHLGTVLIGFAVALAALVLARPRYTEDSRRSITTVILLIGLVVALAGGSNAFGGQGGFSSRRTALVFEVLGWGSVGLLLAAAAAAAGGVRPVTRSAVGLIVGAAGIAALAAFTAAGRTYDLGWWALAFVPLAIGPLLFSPATLGLLDGRYRRSFVPAVVALLGAVAAGRASFGAAFGDEGWRPGAVLLGLAALALLGLALWLYRSTAGADVLDDQAAARAGVIEVISETGIDGDIDLADLDLSTFDADAQRFDVLNPTSPFSDAVGPGTAVVEPIATEAAHVGLEPVAPIDTPTTERPGFDDAEPYQPAPEIVVPTAAPGSPDPVGATAAAVPVEPDPPRPPEPAPATPAQELQPNQPNQPTVPAQPEPSQRTQPAPAPAPAPPSQPAQPEPAQPEPSQPTQQPVSTPATAAAPRASQPTGAHNIDPATGLLSGAGLQSVIMSTFVRPPARGEVALLMIAVRNLAEIERSHGRIAAAQVVAELATRLRIELPEASLSRFVSNAFAAVIEGPAVGDQQQIDRCTGVLIRLLDPVVVESQPIDVDVAASLAQCYDGEDPHAFVDRANTGLERAVAAADPSLVAMP